MNTLLSVNEELTDLEIRELVEEVSLTEKKEGFEKAFEKGACMIQKYAGSDTLKLSIASVLNLLLSMCQVEEADQYRGKIVQWFELAAMSRKEEIASRATVMLVSQYTETKEYEKAQSLLDRIPPVGYNKEMMQAMLFIKQGQHGEAYKIYENIVYKDAGELCSALQLILNLLCKEGSLEAAEKYVQIGKTAAKLFELGIYVEQTPELILALSLQDKKRSLKAIEQLTGGLKSLAEPSKSDLYQHLKLGEISRLDFLRDLLAHALETDGEIDFLRKEPRFAAALKALKTAGSVLK